MKKKMEFLSCNNKTILGLVGLFTLIILSILESFTEFKITGEIRIILLSLIGYLNVRGVLGSGFQDIENTTNKIDNSTKTKKPDK